MVTVGEEGFYTWGQVNSSFLQMSDDLPGPCASLCCSSPLSMIPILS